MGKKFVGILIIVIIATIISTYFIHEKLNKKKSLAPTPQPTTQNQVFPTATQEEIEQVATLDNHIIEITSEGFSPASLSVKAHDQVIFENKGTGPHTVVGEFGEFTIPPGENFSYMYNKIGESTFSVKEFPDLTGIIRVIVN